MRMKFSGEAFHFNDYGMHEELLCVGSSSSRAMRHDLDGGDIAFVDYSPWPFYAICCGIHSPIPSTRASENAC